jgi:glycosyltransferase involved in cell wall biosynthesis
MSSFPPRECGIATFSKHLTDAIDNEYNPGIKSKILAINANGTSIYNYPKKVVMQINESDMEDYLNRANEINRCPDIKVVNIQHEYGLFGGDWGSYLLPFIEIVNKPIVATFHTVLPDPEPKLKKLTQAIADKCNGVITMTQHAARLLESEYDIPSEKIHIIPHGVHHVAFPSKSRAKKKMSLSGYTILSTFGMLNRDKGIEYAIMALPEVVKRYPNVLYLILGATHPVVRKNEGERYRNKLKHIVMNLGLKDHVKFYDKYLTDQEKIDFLKATDIYLSPTLNPLQAVSGTISDALSCACPIIATANQYAKDTVSHERGILVRFENEDDIEKALLELLGDVKARKEMKKNAYFYSRHMTWQNVAMSYFKTFNNFAKIMPSKKGKIPAVNLDHIRTLTDSFGMIQFANHTKPDIHSGYCLDDNARALLGCVKYYDLKKRKSVLKLIELYFDFVKFSQKSNGKFHNFVNGRKDFTDENESQDTFGRTIWALGYAIASENIPENIRSEALAIFKKARRWALDLDSARAIAFTILGLSYILKGDRDEKSIELIKKLSDKLVERYQNTLKEGGTKNWHWFENCLTYSNSKLPEALFRAYEITKNKEYLKVAQAALGFLTSITFEKGYLSPIGQNGWYFRDGKRAYFDQQPEDAASKVDTYAVAHEITGKKDYLEKAKISFEWFLGKNHLGQMVYDEATGGCYDGLGRYSLNFNQGAESTLSYFLARLAIDKYYS